MSYITVKQHKDKILLLVLNTDHFKPKFNKEIKFKTTVVWVSIISFLLPHCKTCSGIIFSLLQLELFLLVMHLSFDKNVCSWSPANPRPVSSVPYVYNLHYFPTYTGRLCTFLISFGFNEKMLLSSGVSSSRRFSAK